MKKLQLVLRLLLGLMFFVFGLNGFFMFIPVPPMPEGVGLFMQALVSTHILMVVKAVEVLVGIMFLTGKFLPLATVALAPITVCILLFHATLTPGEWPMSAVIFAAHLALAWTQKDKLGFLFKA